MASIQSLTAERQSRYNSIRLGVRPDAAAKAREITEVRRHMNDIFMRKVEKARGYALQKERARFANCTVRFQGDNGDHTISYDDGAWDCDCDYLIGRDTCVHIMALQLMLADMMEDARSAAV